MNVPGEFACFPHDKSLVHATKTALQTTGVKVLDTKVARITEDCDPRSFEPALELGGELGLAHPDDQPGPDAAGDRHLCGQGEGCGNLLPPSAHPENDNRDGRGDARRPAAPSARPRICFNASKQPSIPLTQHLMEVCDLTLATGGKPMVKAAYSSGRPAYGVGAGNSSIVIDDTADIEIAAANTRMSKTSDFGSGCSADGNIIIQSSIYERMIAALDRRRRLSLQ